MYAGFRIIIRKIANYPYDTSDLEKKFGVSNIFHNEY